MGVNYVENKKCVTLHLSMLIYNINMINYEIIIQHRKI